MPTFPAAPATPLVFPASPGWDSARKAWDLAVDQHPAAIALPESAAGVIAAVGFARRHGLRVAAQGTGHNAARSAHWATPSWSRPTGCGR